MAKKVSTTKTKDRAATEAKLIEAAEKIFAQVGYEGATTRMIAQEANINISLINRYFEGKYGLLLALVKKISEEFLKQELNYPQQSTATDELVLYGKFILNRYFESVSLIKVCIILFLSDPKFLKKFRDVILDKRIHPEISNRLKALIPNKKFDYDRLIEEIDIHAIGTIIASLFIEGQSEQEIHKSFKDFIINYSKHIEA